MSDSNARARGKVLQQTLAGLRAQKSAMDAVRANAAGDVWAYFACVNFARQYNTLANVAVKLVTPGGTLLTFDQDKIDAASPGNMVAPSQRAMFDNVYLQVLNAIGLLEVEVSDELGELDNLFQALQASFRATFFDAPTKEREVQDNLERFLLARGYKRPLNFDRETGRVKVAGKEFIPDFILPPLGAAIEIKLVSERSNLKAVIEELNADIAAYSSQYKAVVAIVYDVGQIRDRQEFEKGLELVGFVRVLVIKH